MKDTFHEISLSYLDGLYGYAMMLTRNQAAAEDLVQETYLRAARAFGRLRPDSNLKSWMFKILRNIWLNEERHKRSRQLVEMDDNISRSSFFDDDESDDPSALYMSKVKRSDVRAAVEALPSRYREVIMLREFEELSYREIADMLECPTGTVMSRLGRAREKLRQLLQHWNPCEA
jgi:RNA polymerase sigma-70 factor, ECF subfamily